MNKHWKKITSLMLTICMCLCFISTNIWAAKASTGKGKTTKNATKEATTENTDQGIQSGDMWYQVKDGILDIRGYKNGATVQTTAQDEGYPTLLSYDVETTPTKENLIKFADSDYTWKDDKLSVTPAVSFNEKSHSLVVTYTVKNISSNTVKYNLAVIADVAVAGENKSPVTKTENGVKMLDSDKKVAYHMTCRKLANSEDADTIWVGESPRHWENAFNNSTENEISDKNTAMACSWKNKEIKAGETATYSYEVGSGEESAKEDSDDPAKPTESTQETDPTKPTESTQETDPTKPTESTQETDPTKPTESTQETDPTKPTEHQHTYGEPTFTWDHNYTKCTAKFVCSTCNEAVEKSCNIGISEEKDAFFVATIDFDGHKYTDTPKVTISVKKDSKNLVYVECNVPLIYFDSIEMDGKEIDDANYTLKDGSTIITFTNKYMNSLKAGTHTITLVYQINEKTLEVEKKINLSKKSSNSGKEDNKENNKKNGNNTSKTKYNAKGYMTVQVVDKKGDPMKDYSFKVDSKSIETLNSDGRASFGNVLEGYHYLYLKNAKGATLASERIKVEYSTRYRVSGNTVYVMEDKAFVLHVKYNGRNLSLVSVEAGSPKTGDSSNVALWAGLMFVSAFGALFVIRRRKYA